MPNSNSVLLKHRDGAIGSPFTRRFEEFRNYSPHCISLALLLELSNFELVNVVSTFSAPWSFYVTPYEISLVLRYRHCTVFAGS